jgi:lysophospholipase L1-like esterase
MKTYALVMVNALLLLNPASLWAKGKSPGTDVLIVALGDSYTSGAPLYRSPVESPPLGEGDNRSQYAYWIMRRHRSWQVFNAGVTGERTDQIAGRLMLNISLRPDYLIVQGGINDIIQGIPLKKTEDNLQSMYRKIRANGITPVACSILPLNQATPAGVQQIRSLNNWIETTAVAEKIPFADLYKAVTNSRHPDRLSASSDGTHPDIRGYRAMGEALAKVIEMAQAQKRSTLKQIRPSSR